LRLLPSHTTVRTGPYTAVRWIKRQELFCCRRSLDVSNRRASFDSSEQRQSGFHPCAAVRPPCDDLSPESGTQRRPPEVRSTAFTARPPNLPPRSLMAVDFAISCSLVRPGRPRYPVLVHRAAALLHASFRPHLAMTPLRFANPSPPSGWIEDFHLQAVDHARHTTNRPAFLPAYFTGDYVIRRGQYLAATGAP
jgi:hypothetical protein